MTQADAIEVLIGYFKSLIPFNQKEQGLVRQKFQYRRYRRRQYMLQEGDVCKHYIFVVKGCLRMYKIDEQGNEHILKFAAENEWVTEINSFYNPKLSALNIDALENTETLKISRDDHAEGAGGALVKTDFNKPSRNGTIVYFNCEDCAEEEQRAKERGTEVIVPKTSLEQFRFASIIRDREGNLIGLYSLK